MISYGTVKITLESFSLDFNNNIFLSMVDFDRFTAITVPNVHLKIRQLYIPVFFNSCMRGLLLSSFFSQLFINFL